MCDNFGIYLMIISLSKLNFFPDAFLCLLPFRFSISNLLIRLKSTFKTEISNSLALKYFQCSIYLQSSLLIPSLIPTFHWKEMGIYEKRIPTSSFFCKGYVILFGFLVKWHDGSYCAFWLNRITLRYARSESRNFSPPGKKL